MTVSPQRAQDGDPRQNAGDKGVQMDDISRLEALPPTLFKLPNLKVEVEPSPHLDDQPRPPAPPAVLSAARTPAAPTAHGEPVPTGDWAQEHTENGEIRESEPTSPSLEPVSSPPPLPVNDQNPVPPGFPPRSSSPIHRGHDEPAGRSWMDSVRSHGVVVVLLLVVVAAALITSSGSNDADSDETLAESHGSLNIDVGTEVTLPLPAHSQSDSTVAVSDGGLADAVATSHLDPPELTLSLGPAEEEPATSALESDPSGVARNANQTDAQSSDALNSVPVISWTDSIEARTASSRVPSDSSEVGLPSLADLAEPTQLTDTMDVEPPAESPHGATQRPATTTPTGISNLLRHLEDYVTAAAASTDTPSISQ